MFTSLELFSLRSLWQLFMPQPKKYLLKFNSISTLKFHNSSLSSPRPSLLICKGCLPFYFCCLAAAGWSSRRCEKESFELRAKNIYSLISSPTEHNCFEWQKMSLLFAADSTRQATTNFSACNFSLLTRRDVFAVGKILLFSLAAFLSPFNARSRDPHESHFTISTISTVEGKGSKTEHIFSLLLTQSLPSSSSSSSSAVMAFECEPSLGWRRRRRCNEAWIVN